MSSTRKPIHPSASFKLGLFPPRSSAAIIFIHPPCRYPSRRSPDGTTNRGRSGCEIRSGVSGALTGTGGDGRRLGAPAAPIGLRGTCRHARSYTRRTLSDERSRRAATEPGASARRVDPSAAEPASRPLGYKRADVDEALEARDPSWPSCKQDIAALWLAFAQHDRMIRALGGEVPRRRPCRPSGRRRRGATRPRPVPARLEAEAESIGDQLSELDEVLAAIEMATQTLEHTYSDEIESLPPGAPSGDEAGEPEDRHRTPRTKPKPTPSGLTRGSLRSRGSELSSSRRSRSASAAARPESSGMP